MEQILLPTAVEFLGGGNNLNIGKVVISPCHQGYGTTLGNALRRVLLSSLPGAAVESVKISGVQHEFSAIPGVQEDVVEIILNLKQMAVKSHSEQPVTLSLSKKGIGAVTAADFAKNSDVDVANPDLVIAHITDKDYTLDMEITVGRGRGYVQVSEKETKQLSLGTIAIDSLYTPIRDVGYAVEMMRVGDVTDYEKLTLTIETNGTVAPKEALLQATRILMDYFGLISGASSVGEDSAVADEPVEAVVSEETAAVEETADAASEEAPAKKSKKKSKKTE
jgi:DNA-directed RNA polymerase subunit alpha